MSPLRRQLDGAFARRLHAVVEFPVPDAAERERIWRRLITERVPQDDDVDVGFLARQFALAGGGVKNAAAPVACAPVTAVPSDTAAAPPASPPTSPPPVRAETADAAVKISVTTSGTPDAETPVLLAAAPPPAPGAVPGSPPAETTEAAVKAAKPRGREDRMVTENHLNS